MPETKINTRSPFFVKFSQSGMTKLTLDVYVYSGTKNTDKGTKITRIVQKPLPGDDFVILELSSIIRDKMNINADAPLNNNKDYIKWVQLESTITT
tara:strand:+ start:587 stop:874 length:288 start_codon:yes stop_codon:yes gene_type:complete